MGAQPADPAAGANPVAGPTDQGFVSPFDVIESQDLSALDESAVGLLDETNGGFGANLWSGTNRLLVETLLPRVPPAASSAAMTSLARRLVLTRAQLPQGATREVSVVGARLDRAVAIGQVGAVEPIVQQVPQEASSPGVLGARVDALFYQAVDEEACSLAGGARGRSADARWTMRLALCDGVAGRIDQARLGVDVLAETGSDEGFAALMGVLVDKAKVKTVTLARPGAVHFALLRTTDVALDDASLADAEPAFLMAWAANEEAPLPQRLLAAEHAVSSGALGPGVLVALAGRAELPGGTLDQPFGAAPVPQGALGTAYAVQRLTLTEDPSERGHLIAAAFESARARGVLIGVAMALRDDLARLEASDALLDVAPVLGTGEVIAGEGAIARRWLDLMIARHTDETEAGRALRSLLTVRGTAPDLAWEADEMVTRLAAARAGDKARASLEWYLMRALGTAQSESAWIKSLEGPLAADGPAPVPAVLEGLEASSAAGRQGEAVMFALVALGEGGPARSHPSAIVAAVEALRRVGLENDARAVASEALAARAP